MGPFIADVSGVRLVFSMKEIQWSGMYRLVIRYGGASVSRGEGDDLVTCGSTPKNIRMK